MKFLQSRFEEYITATEKNNLHSELEGIYNSPNNNQTLKLNNKICNQGLNPSVSQIAALHTTRLAPSSRRRTTNSPPLACT